MPSSLRSSGKHDSFWLESATLPDFSPLTEPITADVCIIGGGISGLSAAYLLQREGLSVVVLEDGLLASGETGRTTAHLSNAIDDRYTEIERLRGPEAAKLAAESHTAAIDRIERVVADEGIDCDFRRLDGYLILSPEQDADLLHQELAAAHRAGLTSVTYEDQAPLTSIARPCLRFPAQGQFHPLKYLAALARTVVTKGGRIYTRTHVTALHEGPTTRVNTNSGASVEAASVIVATNSPINDRVTMHTKQAAYRTYVVGMRVTQGTVPAGLYWDTEDPYHYVRLQPYDADHDVLIVGGEDHKTGQDHDGIDRHTRLADWAKQWFPMAGTEAFRWSGQVMESFDGLAFIGPNPGSNGKTYIVTGDSGMGMTHGTIAGMLLTDLICGRENRWAELYRPARLVPAGAATEFLSENANVAVQYTDWLTSGDVKATETIAPNQGAILRRGTSKVAVYRDPQGTLHARSAVCPHLGCIVGWNNTEGTWDCPCHGSRFDCYGTVINGPANRNLDLPNEDRSAA
jgi:glycine/D-amino acid oxidase-like deaminating enzyme/nitrite reductase/ring-hydroxylating ferredoxin subunit